ncbi:HD-GYP domain-containing protein [Anaerosalibacter sp. Marseille-P3206]|uniref:HD-GYP domain-containing protein n=1 Tax=Anaerosalibacter sp. Marseille-P3206 TaxID=1871005 RepID=UPI0009845FEE|nr:HD-GYP domain-containing protein [Anaerosalibacter sp. Marseille-P3206]
MNKKEISVISCHENQVLAENVFDDEGVLIAIKNTILTSYVIEKIRLFKVKKIWIYDDTDVIKEVDSYEEHIEEFKKQYIKDTLFIKKAIMELSKGERLNINTVKNVTSSLYNEVMDSHSAVRYISRLKDYNEYTYYHSMNVGIYATLLGKWMGLEKDDLKELTMAGVLHDIGKAKIPNEILDKRGKLTREECAIVKEHPFYGYLMIRDDENIGENVKKTVLMHHEKENGTGYPQGLKGDKINTYAKIVAVADFYDALTSNRPYRNKVSPFEAIDIFIKTGIDAYDVGVSMTFFKNIVNCYIGEKAQISDGRIGEILYVPPYDLTNPIVEIEDEIYDLSRHDEIEIVCLI